VLFFQLPILIALYQVFLRGLSGAAFDNHLFLGLIDLGRKNLPMALVASAAQYFQGKLMFQKGKDPNDPMIASGKMFMVIGPFLTGIVLASLPSALGLYWIVSTAFSIIQQVYINKKLNEDERSLRKT
jgi:YidC/Oxa1 family membrane protein insertase